MAGSRAVRVLVIPEDQTHNGYILRPLVKAIMADAGRPLAKIETPGEPRIRGYVHATTVIREELPALYGFYDIWLFLPDADRASRDAMHALETDLRARNIPLFCSAAQPEVEIYACVAFRKEMNVSWEEARKNPRMKEEIFQPLLDRHGDPRRPDRGRNLMITASLKNLSLLYRLCPELKTLRDRIVALLEAP